MTIQQIESAVDSWHVAPVDQGQAVEVAYGADWENGVLVMRRTDKASRAVTYYTAGAGALDSNWQPWHERPTVRESAWAEVTNG
jgi:hypothetical protein